MKDLKDIFSKVLNITGNGIGEVCVDGEIGTKGDYMDAYLLVIILKEFIDNDDIEIQLKDNFNSKESRINYLNRLIESVNELKIEDQDNNTD